MSVLYIATEKYRHCITHFEALVIDLKNKGYSLKYRLVGITYPFACR